MSSFFFHSSSPVLQMLGRSIAIKRERNSGMSGFAEEGPEREERQWREKGNRSSHRHLGLPFNLRASRRALIRPGALASPHYTMSIQLLVLALVVDIDILLHVALSMCVRHVFHVYFVNNLEDY